jgi:hypothetical protein
MMICPLNFSKIVISNSNAVMKIRDIVAIVNLNGSSPRQTTPQTKYGSLNQLEKLIVYGRKSALFIVNILRKYFILEKYNKINIYLYKYLK